MAFALPFLTLSFGYQPSQADMDAGKRAASPSAIPPPVPPSQLHVCMTE